MGERRRARSRLRNWLKSSLVEVVMVMGGGWTGGMKLLLGDDLWDKLPKIERHQQLSRW